ncbi:hypothetical protein [Nonomuraea salmonea]|uniref:HK97 gp10 family phage protein n=1 Tax=Nonomuraea salmonea TaxID=46181 RepID=A0ABV5P323_9ACTN
MRVEVHRAELRRLTESSAGPLVRHVEALTRLTANAAKRNVRVDDGTLRASIQPTVTVTGWRIVGRVGTSLAHGWYMERGTGVYGPRGRPIRPVRAKVLRFEARNSSVQAKGRGRIVFARQVKGVKGDRWLTRALEEVSPYRVSRPNY